MRVGHSTSDPSVRGSYSAMMVENNGRAPCSVFLPFPLLVDRQTDTSEPSSTLSGHWCTLYSSSKQIRLVRLFRKLEDAMPSCLWCSYLQGRNRNYIRHLLLIALLLQTNRRSSMCLSGGRCWTCLWIVYCISYPAVSDKLCSTCLCCSGFERIDKATIGDKEDSDTIAESSG